MNLFRNCELAPGTGASSRPRTDLPAGDGISLPARFDCLLRADLPRGALQHLVHCPRQSLWPSAFLPQLQLRVAAQPLSRKSAHSVARPQRGGRDSGRFRARTELGGCQSHRAQQSDHRFRLVEHLLRLCDVRSAAECAPATRRVGVGPDRPLALERLDHV